jgi:tetratricopeptide (TPR) repeat protein
MIRLRRAWKPEAAAHLSPLLGAACAGLILSACGGTPAVVKDSAPTIRQTMKKEAPVEQQIKIDRTDLVAPDPDKALENYRQLLQLNPDEGTRAEAQRRIADLQVQTDDVKGGGEDSAATLDKSIKIYNQLLLERPGDVNNDRVFYQLARAQQNSGNSDAAIDTLAKLNHEFPDSNLGGDAHFRRAELLFQRERFAEAETEYHVVMDMKDRTPFFEPAQYKYGWSLYKQNKYDAAIGSFFQILDRELPAGEVTNVDAVAGVKKGKSDLVKDSLRVVSLSLAAQGGGQAANDYFKKYGDPRFYPLIYDALGKLLIERERYTDAAEAFAAFPQRYPTHPLSPTFQSQVIGAYTDGGFKELVIREKERYAVTYDPQAAYWGGKPATPEVLTELRKHMEDLARHHHALAQASKADTAKSRPEFIVAANWYKRILEVFPSDSKAPDINFLYGDALLDGGRTREAAEQYARTAYDYKPHPRTADAALASFQSYEKYAKEVPAAQRPAALRLAVDSGIKLADSFQYHPEKLPVLTQAAQDLYELKALDEAVKVSQRVLTNTPPAKPELQRIAYSVIGDAEFEQKHFPEAEAAFAQELKLTPASPARHEVSEQLAASIYKQGEAARDAGDQRRAVGHFLRLGEVVPDASIRPNAEYDAAATLVQMEDWPTAARVLEGFRSRFPTSNLIADVDKKLAVSYQKDNKPAQAAAAYNRIAQRQSETPAVRMEAAWLTATLYDEAKLPAQAGPAYQYYVGAFPRPIDRAMQARSRLVDISRDSRNTEQQLYWLREIVNADAAAGGDRSDLTKALAAKSSLELGRITAAQAKTLRITLPIESSLPAKQKAVEAAIQAFNRAAGYGFADVTTAATYELGTLHQDFAKSLTDSERPKKLSDLELEQYNLLLEEQAFPFEEKAIEAHESNLRRIPQGIYDEWVAKSAKALAQLAPGKYGKREKGEEFYESLK